MNSKYANDLDNLHGQFEDIVSNIEIDKKRFRDLEPPKAAEEHVVSRPGETEQLFEQYAAPQNALQPVPHRLGTPSQPQSHRNFSGQDTPVDYQMFSLSVDNKRLKQENADQQMQIFELQQDLHYLQESIENHLPMISELEIKNRQLEDHLQT